MTRGKVPLIGIGERLFFCAERKKQAEDVRMKRRVPAETIEERWKQ